MKNNKSTLRKRTTRTCPRCGEVCLLNQTKCPDCGLIFARLQFVTNKEGKKAVKKKEKERVLYITQPTYDMSKWTALILCGLLGYVGGHCYYLGRYRRGIFLSICFLFAAFVLLPLNESAYYGTWWYQLIFYTFAPFGACTLIFWVLDFVNILFEKFKFPVALPPPDYEKMKEGLELDKIEEDTLLAKSLNEDAEEVYKKNNKSNKSKKKQNAEKKVIKMTPKNVEEKEEVKEELSEEQKEKTEKEEKDERKIVTIKNKKYGSYNNTKNKKSKK